MSNIGLKVAGALGALIFFVGVYGIAAALDALSLQEESRTWPSVQGAPISASVSYCKGPRAAPRVEYRYVIGGVEYIGNDISAQFFSCVRTDEAKAYVDAFMKMPSMPVYFDPKNPSRSLLAIDESISVTKFSIFLLGCVAFVGLLFAVSPFLNEEKRRALFG